MPILAMRRPFNQTGVDSAPAAHGVYALFREDTLTYYGRAHGDGVTIRSRLQSHLNGEEGVCTQQATSFAFELTESSIFREKALLTEFKELCGQLPECNERIG